MGAGKSTNAAFYSIMNGKICRAFKSPDAETETRTNKNGKVVHEKYYDYLEGNLVGISTKENDYGKFWVVVLEDADGRYQLEINYSSGFAQGFLKALPNVDLQKKIKLIPSVKTEGDKKKTTLFINQGGHAVKWYYKKDDRNGLPDLKQIKVKGKVTWDDSDIMEFLEEMVNNDIVPQLGKNVKAEEVPAELQTAEAAELNNDLPF